MTICMLCFAQVLNRKQYGIETDYVTYSTECKDMKQRKSVIGPTDNTYNQNFSQQSDIGPYFYSA
jgi:hypothetical protein